MAKIFIILLILAGVGFYLFSNGYIDTNKNASWMIFICEANPGPAGCEYNDVQAKKFGTSDACLSYGKASYSERGFKCGKNCSAGEKVLACEQICESSGCK